MRNSALNTIALFFTCIASMSASASWFPQKNNCDETYCAMRNTAGSVLWHIPDVPQMTWDEAAATCSAKNMRLPTYSEMNEGWRQGVHFIPLQWPNFGDVSWFFWYADHQYAFSFSNQQLNPITGLRKARVICGRDAGPLPPNPPVTEQVNTLGQETTTTGNQFVQEMNQGGGIFSGMESPEAVGDVRNNGTGKITFKEPAPYREQRETSRQNNVNGPGNSDVGHRPCSGWNKCISSSFKRGNNNFAAEMSYQLRGKNNGETANSSDVSVTVFGLKRSVVDLTARGYHEGNYYKFQATSRILNQAYDFYDYSLERGKTYTYQREIYIRKTFFKKSWTFVIGVVPVTVTALVRGEAGRDESRWGYLIYDSDQYSRVVGDYNLYSGIWGAMQGGPGIPGVTAGVGGAVEFISGTISLLGNAGFSAADGRGNICFIAMLRKMKTMSGEVYIFLEYPELQVQTVTHMVDGVCSRVGGWLGEKVCGPARQVTETVERVIDVYKHKTIYKLPGRVLVDNHYWYNDCEH